MDAVDRMDVGLDHRLLSVGCLPDSIKVPGDDVQQLNILAHISLPLTLGNKLHEQAGELDAIGVELGPVV